MKFTEVDASSLVKGKDKAAGWRQLFYSKILYIVTKLVLYQRKHFPKTSRATVLNL